MARLAALVASGDLFEKGKWLAIGFGVAAAVPVVVLLVTKTLFRGDVPAQYRTRMRALAIFAWCAAAIAGAGVVLMLVAVLR